MSYNIKVIYVVHVLQSGPNIS